MRKVFMFALLLTALNLSVVTGVMARDDGRSSYDNPPRKDCIDKYGKTACGYGCAASYGKVRCSKEPNGYCFAKRGKIICTED